MARQISSIQFKGKLGENVGFTGLRGQAFVRKANTSVKNPRTTGQNVQRMILATVGTSIGHLSEVLNSSVQGKSRGAETLAYLRGEWMRQLRVQNIFDGSNTLRYAVKGYSGFTPNPYLLSKGTLYGPATTIAQGFLAMNSDDLAAPDAVKTATQLFPTIALGDQITLICCYKESGAAPYYNEQPISCAYLRFAFKDDSVPALITAEDSTLRLNPAAIDLNKAAGAWRSVIIMNDGTGVGAFNFNRIARGQVVAGALLVSNLEGNKRSTSYLSVDNNAGLYWGASVAEPTFGNNATPLDFASDIYLNNSAVTDSDRVLTLRNAPVVGGAGITSVIAIEGGSWTETPQLSDARLRIRVTDPDTDEVTEYTTKNLTSIESAQPVIEGVAGIVLEECVANANGTIAISLIGQEGAFPYIVLGGSCIVDNAAYSF